MQPIMHIMENKVFIFFSWSKKKASVKLKRKRPSGLLNAATLWTEELKAHRM